VIEFMPQLEVCQPERSRRLNGKICLLEILHFITNDGF